MQLLFSSRSTTERPHRHTGTATHLAAAVSQPAPPAPQQELHAAVGELQAAAAPVQQSLSLIIRAAAMNRHVVVITAQLGGLAG